MNYDESNRYNEDEEDSEVGYARDSEYNNDFGMLMRQRRRRTGPAIYDSDEYKPRTRKSSSSQYAARPVQRRTTTPSVGVRRHSSAGSSQSLKRRRPVQTGRSGAKSKSSAKKNVTSMSSVLVCVLCVLVIVTVLASVSVNAIYKSSIFSDDGADDLDNMMIQERLITSKENKDKVTYFLIAGVDKSSMLTDCIWIMCFDNEAHKMNVMQVPRDTHVGDASQNHKVNGVYSNPQTVNWCENCQCVVEDEYIYDSAHTNCGGKVVKKTESNIGALIRYINDHLSLPIDHYVLFDFQGFEKVIDALGGVDITLDKDLRVYRNKRDYEVMNAGENHLDGKMALKFMRNRQAYVDGDLGRVKAQRQVVHAIMDKVMDMSAIDAFSVLRAAYGNFSTDMSLEDIRSFISPAKKCTSDDALYMFEMPGESYWAEPHEYHQSYYVCNEGETAAAINAFLLPYSDKITTSDISFPMPS